jgi:hypothetical protein
MKNLKRHTAIPDTRFDRIEGGKNQNWNYDTATDDELDRLRDLYPDTYARYFTETSGTKPAAKKATTAPTHAADCGCPDC